MRKLSFFRLFLLLTPLFGFSQNCNCDVTLTGLSSTSLNLIWSSQLSYSPGDIICIPAGNYAGIRFYDLQGTQAQPLVIKNCNGQVVINETGYSGLEFRNSKYIHLTGTGDSNHDYGIKVAGTSSWAMGISLGNFSTDFEVDHIEVASAGFAGLMAKTDPHCNDSNTWRVNGFIMKNLNIHHNIFKNTGGEGIYIGFSLGYKLDIARTCNGTPIYGHWLEDVSVHHNIIENTGWDGIQLNLVRSNGKIHDNYIYNYGTEDRYAQDFAMSFGGGTYEVYNNVSINGPLELGQGFQTINGQSGSKIYNNVIVRPKLHGIFAHARHNFNDPNEGYYIANNTIIEPERAGVHYNTTLINPTDPADLHKSQDNVPSYFVNNLVVDPGYDFEGGNTWKQNQESYFDFNEKSTRDSLLTNIHTNIMTRQIDTLGLSDIANDDYSPSDSSSSVVDEGSNVSSWGITFDIENLSRPSGNNFDIGAYEYFNTGGSSLQAKIPEIPYGPGNSLDKTIIYPNPATESFQFYNTSLSSARLQIFGLGGKLFFDGAHDSKTPFDISGYKKGIYIIKTISEGKTETQRLVIE